MASLSPSAGQQASEQIANPDGPFVYTVWPVPTCARGTYSILGQYHENRPPTPSPRQAPALKHSIPHRHHLLCTEMLDESCINFPFRFKAWMPVLAHSRFPPINLAQCQPHDVIWARVEGRPQGTGRVVYPATLPSPPHAAATLGGFAVLEERCGKALGSPILGRAFQAPLSVLLNKAAPPPLACPQPGHIWLAHAPLRCSAILLVGSECWRLDSLPKLKLIDILRTALRLIGLSKLLMDKRLESKESRESPRVPCSSDDGFASHGQGGRGLAPGPVQIGFFVAPPYWHPPPPPPPLPPRPRHDTAGRKASRKASAGAGLARAESNAQLAQGGACAGE
ncbi:uncharacterized protein VTP21DRAFT_9293 [Calcarisporiella thermophila]|uniref:uncharacterized protein n=1 Tax=Calcarisporiella thermophila TaxID=911321 RepID=UPI0037436FE4